MRFFLFSCFFIWLLCVNQILGAQVQENTRSRALNETYRFIDPKLPAAEQLAKYRSVNIENIRESLQFLAKLQELAIKENDASIILEVSSEYAYLLSAKGDNQAAKETIEGVYNAYNKQLNACQSLRLLIQRTNIAIDLNELERAEEQLKDAVKSSCAQELYAEIDWVNAYLEFTQGHYPTATELYNRAYEANKKSNNISGMRRNLFGRGSLFFRQNEFDQAEKAYLEAQKYLRPPFFNINQLNINQHLANIYGATQRNDEARAQYQSALDIAASLQDSTATLRILLNLAIYESQLQNTEAALQTYDNAMALAQEMNNEFGVLMVKMNKGTLLFMEGQLDAATEILQEALDYTIKNGLLNEYRYLVKLLTDVYKAKGDQSNLIVFLNQQISTLETMLGQRQQKEIDELKALHDLEVKDRELESTRNRYIAIILVLLMLGTSALVILMYRSRNLRRLYQLNLELYQAESSGAISELNLTSGNDEPLHALYLKIKQAMEEEKMYRLSDLSLPMLASHIASNEKYTSSAISGYSNTNFNGFVNRYRIQEAKRILLEHGDKVNIGELVEVCGFASRSTFYKAFSDQTGMTPKEFIRLSRP